MVVNMQNKLRSIHRAAWTAVLCVACTANTIAATTNAPLIPGNDGLTAVRQSDSWKIALAPHSGNEKLDEQIRKLQDAIRTLADPRAHLERLGWLYVAKARASHDPGFYKLAEHCALALQSHAAKSPEALLLRGHVEQSLHRFKEAEAIARELVARREFAFDHGLLGDALADQGKLDEAIAEYQRMVDLRPDLQSYSRVAHARWLKGDLSGAIEAAELAARACSPADADSAAWAFTRLATYEFQAGALVKAETACQAALEFVKDYPPALLLRGKMLLSPGKAGDAVEVTRRAVAKSPLPEYQWTLADALRAAGLTNEAITIEAELTRTGAANDPRALALFLATRGEQVGLALRLAERELKDRGDVFTHDALAWALFNSARHAEAWNSMKRALAEGTQDARLFLHAGAIAARLGHNDAGRWLKQARELERLLLPSERRRLDDALQLLSRNETPVPSLAADAP